MVGRKQLYTLFLLALIATKVSALNIYSHYLDDTHIDDCELCEQAIYNQAIEFYTSEHFYQLEVAYLLVFSEKGDYSENVHIKSPIDTTRYGRPPPSLV